MRTLDKLCLRLRSLFRRNRADEELDREIQFHLDLQIEENFAAGMSPEEARYAATRAMGGVAQVEEQCRDARRVNLIDGVFKDFRLALRTLQKDFTFTVVSGVTLALGIGATTAIFTVVNGVILRPLPFRAPERLVTLWQVNPNYHLPDTPAGAIRFSPGNYLDLRDRNRAFSEIGAFARGSYNLTGAGDPTRVTGGLVSASLFDMLGVRPALGRSFIYSDDRPDADRGVILGRSFWMEKFGGDPGVIDRSLRLDDRSHTIIGVMPAFEFLNEDADVWLPIERKIAPENMQWRRSYYVGVIARLSARNLRRSEAQQSAHGPYAGRATVRDAAAGRVRRTHE
jgi:putative ABC transport system permease protein